MDIKKIINFTQEHEVALVDFKFCDMLGYWRHITMPSHALNEEIFKEGFAFDGSSLPGWRSINDSDMIALPDASTLAIDPFYETPTASFICDIRYPDTLAPYERDPRTILRKAIEHLKKSGIADTAYFGPEAEFFIFDHVKYDSGANFAFYEIDSAEAAWATGRSEENSNPGYKTRHKEAYCSSLPHDFLSEIRNDICIGLENLAIPVERHHHEVASAGQCEINIKFDAALEMADKMMWFKYVIKNVARNFGKTATFMPKPLFGDNGSGMHLHMSLWKNGTNLFAGDKYAGLSQLALYAIGGILKNAPALCGIVNPTTNSYKRLVPGFEAPTKLAYSHKNRSAAIRIPTSGTNPKSKRFEFRTPDPMANIYLAQAAMIMAAVDGVINKINPGEPCDKDLYHLNSEDAAKIPTIPGSLEEALTQLKSQGDFLCKGDVFDSGFIDAWITYKMEKEVLAVAQRPVPYEFALYYDL